MPLNPLSWFKKTESPDIYFDNDKKKIEITGNQVKVSKSDFTTIFDKANPTNKDIMTVLKALYERG